MNKLFPGLDNFKKVLAVIMGKNYGTGIKKLKRLVQLKLSFRQINLNLTLFPWGIGRLDGFY